MVRNFTKPARESNCLCCRLLNNHQERKNVFLSSNNSSSPFVVFETHFYKLIVEILCAAVRGNEDQFLKLVSSTLKFRCQITEAIFNEILTKLG